MNPAKIIILIVLILQACNPGKRSPKHQDKESAYVVAIPQTGYMVYKTRADYLNKVPVQLSEDKKTIISYPSASDLKRKGSFTFPVELAENYLLDRRGIGLNTAFLEWTYETYFTEGGAPSVKDLKELIVDDDPFLELYQCPHKNEESDVAAYINGLIMNGALGEKCKRLK